jgi:transcriptional regulator with XRE-family HTH domain
MQDLLNALLRRLRADEPLRDAAARIGISHTYLSILEKGIDPRNGNAVKPSAETLQKLARAYNYPYEKLMEAAGYLNRGEFEQNKAGDQTPVELEKILRETRVMLEGVVLDDEDKEDLIQFMKMTMRTILKRKDQS